MPFRLKGRTEMKRKLERVAREHPERLARAEYAEMQIEATEMKRRTPVDTTPDAPHPGLLRNGIHVEQPQIEGNRVSTIVATSPQTPYDIYVHENPDAIHPIGQWKFMESVLNESAPHMGRRLATRMRLDEEE